MNFDSSKNLSAIGSLLIVIGWIGSAVSYVGVLSLVGAILLLIGLKGLANYYKEDGIFNNSLYAIISGIVGVVVAGVTIVITAVATLASLGIDLSNVEEWTNIGPEFSDYFTAANFGTLWTFISAVIIAFVVLFVFAIIAMYFFRKSLNQLSTKTGVGLFGTAGLLMIIGAVLTIVGIGLLIIWIGWILVTVAFFKMKEKQNQTPPPP